MELSKLKRYYASRKLVLLALANVLRVSPNEKGDEYSLMFGNLNRKNALFAGSDEGGANWAIVASLIETCKLNGVNPHPWFAETLTKLVNRWPASLIDNLMPWAYAKIPA
jgi:hypothetical protein